MTTTQTPAATRLRQHQAALAELAERNQNKQADLLIEQACDQLIAPRDFGLCTYKGKRQGWQS